MGARERYHYVVDNVFLSIVSQQIDKITGFHDQATYTSMRDYINSGLFMGTVVALPVVALVGGVLGALAVLVRSRLTCGTLSAPDHSPTVSPA